MYMTCYSTMDMYMCLLMHRNDSMQTNTAYNVAPANQVPNNDPLYSVIEGNSSCHYTNPSGRPPYNQERISNQVMTRAPTIAKTYYEQPIITSLKKTGKKVAHYQGTANMDTQGVG